MARRRGGGAAAAIGELGFLQPTPEPQPEPEPEPQREEADSAPAIEAVPEAPATPDGDGQVPEPDPAPASPLSEVDQLLDRRPKESAPPRRRSRRRPRPAEVSVELRLPEDLLNRSRSLVRPHRTGARRSLGAAFVLQAYVRAVDEILAGELDTAGVEAGMDEEMIARVRAELERVIAEGG